MKFLKVLLSISVLMVAECAFAREIFVNVDFYDEIYLLWHKEKRGYTAADATNLLQRIRATGAVGINLRTASIGITFHPSKIAWGIEEAAAKGKNSATVVARRTPEISMVGHGVPKWALDGGRATNKEIKDVVQVFTDACRHFGLKINLWIDIFDEAYGKFATEHPECMVKNKAGKTFPALRDYSNEFAVSNKLAEIEEFFKYRPDGFYFCPSCHTRHMYIDDPNGSFGTLPAAKFTQFLRRAKAMFKPYGFKLIVGTPCGKTLDFCSPYFSNNVKYKIEYDWKTWVDERIVDGLVVADYELLRAHNGSWEAKGFRDDGSGRLPIDHFLKEFPDYTKGRVPLYYFSTWLTKDNLKSVLRQGTEDVLKFGLDGMFIHEAMSLEQTPGGFEEAAEMNRRFKAGK